MTNLGELINLDKDLDAIAIIDDNTSITYKNLLALSNKISLYLLKQGIKSGDKVATFKHNNIEFIASFLGTLKIGAVFVPINPNLPSSVIDSILKDSAPKIILKEIVEEQQENNLICSLSVKDSDPAIILYTSGSTANPKGVIIPHSHKHTITRKIKTLGMKLIVSAPTYHMNGLSFTEFALASHSTLILMQKFEAKKFIENILKYRVSTITSVPAMLYLLLKEKEILINSNFKFVKHVITASAPAEKYLFEQLKLYFPEAEFINSYGSTEIGPSIFGKHPYLPTPIGSVGYPKPEINYRLNNSILEVKSSSMFLDYSNSIPNFTKDGYFITNDLFHVDKNGFYYFVGRIDDMFISGGHNIYPRQIESLLEEHPSISQAAVIGINDEIKGMKPFAFVTAVEEINISQIKEFILTKIEPYACPRDIWVVDQMPMSETNKIDKKKLKEDAIKLLYKV